MSAISEGRTNTGGGERRGWFWQQGGRERGGRTLPDCMAMRTQMEQRYSAGFWVDAAVTEQRTQRKWKK